MAGTELAPLRARLQCGLAIPAHPLALTAARRLDERRQVALTRYYCDAGAGGVAVGVHTTQFAIRDPRVGLFEPVLRLAAEAIAGHEQRTGVGILRIAGICGPTTQACAEAATAASFGYDAGLLSLAALRDASNADVLAHCREVGATLPIVGFYLQTAVGGRPLDYAFWRAFFELERVVAVKIAPFNRYQTLDVVRALADSGRRADIALYTGNDDAIVADLLTPFAVGSGTKPLRVVGGLLGQWAVWTRGAVTLLQDVHNLNAPSSPGTDGTVQALLAIGSQITDVNAALFDVAHNFAGCIAGLHEVLRRQGMLEGRWCLDPAEDLSPGQAEAIDRVIARYPHLADDAFVEKHRDRWLA